MADDQDLQPLKFTIRRLSPGGPLPHQGGPEQKSYPQATPIPSESPRREALTSPEIKREGDLLPELLPSTDGSTSGALFRNANAILAFLSSTLGSGLSDQAVVRREPKSGWWGEVDVPFDRIAPLIWTTGGQPFTRLSERWVAVTPSGALSTLDMSYEIREVAGWAVVELASLLAETNLLPGRYRGAYALDVVVPGSLGRWILRRAAALGLRVGIVPALRRPISGQSNEEGVLLLRLRSDSERNIPAAFVYSLAQLPYLIIGELIEGDGRSILVDSRHRLPLAPTIVQNMIPVGEIWVFGPPDAGYWRLQTVGAEVDGSVLMEGPSVNILGASTGSTFMLPQPIPVQLVSRPTFGSRVEAVLLDAPELQWLQVFLMGRPADEISFLLPGQDVYLLIAPGGLPVELPFGIPLVRVGPGGFYLELGTDFYPPLPLGARRARFALTDESAVVVTRNGAYRFAAAHMLPAWALWVGESPTVQGDLSKDAEHLLARISAAIRKAEADRIVYPPPSHGTIDREELLRQAQRAELAGNLLQAAELLELAGHPGPAGRLYERAAAVVQESR